MRWLRSLWMLSLLAILVACGGAEPAAEDAIVSTDPPDAAEPSSVESPVSEIEPDVRPEPEPEPTVLPPLLNPAHPDANATAPAEYRVAIDTTKGDIVLQVYRHWAPLGADRSAGQRHRELLPHPARSASAPRAGIRPERRLEARPSSTAQAERHPRRGATPA